MKNIIKYTGFLFCLVIGLSGCYRDVILPDAAVDPDGPPQSVSFKTDVAPMVNTKCALAGCHVSGGHKPNMTIGGSYVEIVNNGYVNTILPKQSIIYQKINGEMQQYIPSAVDRQKIYDWIRTGALNN
jgi:hypothetical protein